MTQVSLCPPELVRPALELLLRELPASAQADIVNSLHSFVGGGLAPFGALAVARDGDQIRGACWVQPQAGNGGAFWLPTQTSKSPQVAEELARVALNAADAAGVALTQLLLDAGEPGPSELLSAVGFQRLAELAYQRWRVVELPAAADLPEIEITPFDPRDQARLERLVLATYEGSQDCPAVDGLRSIREILAGYREVGDSGAELWSILRHNGDDAGVLLLAEYHETNQLELVYLGITPESRGRRLGASAVRYVQDFAHQRGVDDVVLAVDVANLPARRQYEAAGFADWARRVAYIRPRAQ
jgi:ribosomal protein S18 acetylase RimI-like enzyme